MGDRICLRFTAEGWTGDREVSPTLYAHWYGKDLLKIAANFWKKYKDELRHKPSNWMVNFIVHLRDTPEDGGLYLYASDETACGPDDNGYWEFDVDTGVCVKTRMGDFDGGESVGTEYEEEEE